MISGHNQRRLGALIAGAGLIWAAHVSTVGFTNMQTLFPLPRGPLEVCGAGVILWLHARWRGAVTLK